MIEAHAADTRSNQTTRPRWSIALPQGEVAARLTLLGVVIVLHNLLEAPRDPLTQAIGAPLTGLLAFLALTLSLGLLLLALGERAPQWRWLRSRRAQTVILALTLGAALIGVKQLGTMVVASFQPPYYPNDGATLDQYAAQQLLEGHNPYVTTSISAAVQFYHQPPEYTTPLHTGPFAGRALTDYPSAAERTAAFNGLARWRRLRGQAELSGAGVPAARPIRLGRAAECDAADAALRVGAGRAARHLGAARSAPVDSAALPGGCPAAKCGGDR